MRKCAPPRPSTRSSRPPARSTSAGRSPGRGRCRHAAGPGLVPAVEPVEDALPLAPRGLPARRRPRRARTPSPWSRRRARPGSRRSATAFSSRLRTSAAQLAGVAADRAGRDLARCRCAPGGRRARPGGLLEHEVVEVDAASTGRARPRRRPPGPAGRPTSRSISLVGAEDVRRAAPSMSSGPAGAAPARARAAARPVGSAGRGRRRRRTRAAGRPRRRAGPASGSWWRPAGRPRRRRPVTGHAAGRAGRDRWRRPRRGSRSSRPSARPSTTRSRRRAASTERYADEQRVRAGAAVASCDRLQAACRPRRSPATRVGRPLRSTPGRSRSPRRPGRRTCATLGPRPVRRSAIGARPATLAEAASTVPSARDDLGHDRRRPRCAARPGAGRRRRRVEQVRDAWSGEVVAWRRSAAGRSVGTSSDGADAPAPGATIATAASAWPAARQRVRGASPAVDRAGSPPAAPSAGWPARTARRSAGAAGAT